MAATPGRSRSPEGRVPADGDLPLAVRAYLVELVDASGALGDALMNHNHDAIVSAVERTDAIIGEVRQRVDAMPRRRGSPRFDVTDAELGALRDALRTAARKNALLIERAWETDVATFRLLASLGRQNTANGPAGVYGSAAPPSYLDTPA